MTARVASSTQARRVLIVDDDQALCTTLERCLGRTGWTVTWRTTPEQGFLSASEGDHDVVVTDLRMPRMNGAALCERIVAARPDLPVIVVTAFGNLEAAISAIRAGAYDFLTKPFEVEVLEMALHRATQHRRMGEEVRRLRHAVREASRVGELLGTSPAMQGLFRVLQQVAGSGSPVLIRGETGSGKELVARALHARGPRKDEPFLAVNCAAVPEALLQAELFGDAREGRDGLLRRAGAGAVLLEEVSELPAGLQARLLRALQERRIHPAGGSAELPFEARILASTSRDLDAAVEEGRFRQDLLFRLNVISVDVPPLRSRGSDVLLLAQRFLETCAAQAGKRVTGLTGEAAERLLAYAWPGNVRELSNCIERAVALARHDKLVVDDLPERIRSYRASHVLVAAEDPAELVPMEEVERRYVLRVLEATRGNKSVAARVLGFDRKTLYRKLERWGVGSEGAGEG